MSWAKLDDQFPQHPKVLRAGPDAAWLHVCAVCYCAQYLTDGFVPKEAVATVSTLRHPGRLAARLVEVGLWHDRGDQYEVHDYLTYNPSRAHVEGERAAAKSRRQKQGSTGGRASPNSRPTRGRTSGDVPATDTSPVPEPESPTDSSRASRPRTPDVVFESICAAVGWPIEELTPDARGRVNAAAKQLRDLGADPTAIHSRARKYRQVYPNVAITPQALTGNWAALGNGAASTSTVKPGPYECPLELGCSNGWSTNDAGEAVRCACISTRSAA